MLTMTKLLATVSTDQLTEMFRLSFSDDSAEARMVRSVILGVYEDRNGEDAADALRDEFYAFCGV